MKLQMILFTVFSFLSTLVFAQIDTIRIACVGNSITEGLKLDNPELECYPAQLGQMLGNNYRVGNFGISGRTMLKKGDYPIWDEALFDEAIEFKADIVIILLGTNDSKHYNWTHKAEFIPDCIEMIDSFRQAVPKPRIYAGLPPPAFVDNYNIKNSVISGEIIPMIKKVADSIGVSLIDFYTPLLDKGALFPDGIHPDIEGAEEMANIILSTLIRQVAHWPMDEGSGTVVTELVDSNNGTIVGLDPAMAWLPPGGAQGGGVRFDNIDGNHIEVPNAYVLDFIDESFTISMLVRYPVPPTDNDRWFIKGTHEAPGTGSRYELFHTGSNSTVRFSIDNGPADVKSKLEVHDSVFVTGGWVHVVAVRDAVHDTLMIYANAEFQGGIADKSGDISNGEPLWIGESTDETGTAMSGDINDVRIYNYALSADEINDLFISYDIHPGIDDEESPALSANEIMQNYPNPFNITTTIEYSLPRPTRTEIIVYDLLGHWLDTLVDDYRDAGTHRVVWDASGLPAGVYMCQLKTDDFIVSKKMKLIK
jgi:lysophospholipase L1-like esterase